MKKSKKIKLLLKKIQDLEFEKHTLNNDIELLIFKKNSCKSWFKVLQIIYSLK